jgi:hypothetical protein
MATNDLQGMVRRHHKLIELSVLAKSHHYALHDLFHRVHKQIVIRCCLLCGKPWNRGHHSKSPADFPKLRYDVLTQLFCKSCDLIATSTIDHDMGGIVRAVIGRKIGPYNVIWDVEEWDCCGSMWRVMCNCAINDKDIKYWLPCDITQPRIDTILTFM